MSSRACAWIAALLATACLDAPPDTSDAAQCGTTRALRDDFSGDSGLWERIGDHALADDLLRLYAGPSTTAGITSVWEYRVAGSELTMQLRNLYLEPGSELRMRLVDGGDGAIGLAIRDNILSLVVETADGQTRPAQVPYDPEIKWLRLGEANGSVFVATSPNGSNWTERGKAVHPLANLVAAQVDLTSPVGVQATVDIEAINPDTAEGQCPMSSLAEDFDPLSGRWEEQSPAGCTLTSDGALAIAYDGNGECGIYSRERFDLRGGSAAVDVVDAGGCDPGVLFTVELDSIAAEIMCFDDGGSVLFAMTYGGAGETTEIATVDFEPERHRLWRFRHAPEQAQLLFETASAAGDWELLGVAAVPEADLAAAAIFIHVEDERTDGDMAPVVFDRLNLVP